jgi:Helix-turn-helix domain
LERDFKGVWIPKEVWLNEDLGWSEKLLLVEIDSLAKNGECFASNEYLGKFLRLSKKRVSELITDLNRRGYLTVDLIYKEGTKEVEKRVIRPLAENRYTPSGKSAEALAENAERPLAENRYYNNTLITNTNINTMSKTNKTTTGQMEKEFEQLWAKYPRKIGKKKAFDSFKKARKVKKVPYEVIENGLNRYLDYVQTRELDEQYIQHGSTWFNQEKWQDDYISIAPQRKATSFLDYYQEDFGGENYDVRRYGEIIEHDSTLIP